jgi:predicted DNA-binding transcriptional regulator YafY
MKISSEQNQSDSGLRRGVERRLQFVDYRLFWEGQVNRADIMEKFGVSLPQASNDLTQYRELAPGNIQYDPSSKRYLRSATFTPTLFKPNASHYLVELKAVADEVLAPGESWIGSAPSVDAMPVPGRRVDPEMLRSLIEAMRNKRSLHANYHSMRSEHPVAAWQWITPHAFSSDGLRWHVRAYCHIEDCFKDFLLSRFLEVGKLGDPGAEDWADNDWCSFFDVVLIPNPSLPAQKQQTIAIEYDMKDGRLVVPVRCALLYYFNKRLRLDLKEIDQPHETPVVVSNHREFQKAVREATGSVRRPNNGE